MVKLLVDAPGTALCAPVFPAVLETYRVIRILDSFIEEHRAPL
jgi:hypothetical protein